MNNISSIGFILILSILVQASAAILSIRLIKITGKRSAWIFIALSLTLMAIRRIVPLFRMLTGDQSIAPDPINELIGLVLSISMLVGIAFIAPLFIERKKVEEKIRRFNQELEQRVAERTTELVAANKELEAFAYSIAHDLRSPLRGIDGFSQVLLEEYQDKLDEQGKHYLHRVRSATQRMGQIIDDILNLSRVSRWEMYFQMVNLSRIAQNIANDLKGIYPERKVEFVIHEGIHVRGDSQILSTVLEYLLENAWKFTSKHPTAHIEFGVQQQNDKQVYFVRDDGAGFDMNYAQRLFGAFQRLHTNDEFTGTGIGLATVQRIIHRHGGKIWAEGEVEKGATFYFTIP